jgi:hypothetical protein
VIVHINMVRLHLQACKFYDEKWNPKFTLIIAQKSHHTNFFIPGKPENVPPGNLHHLPVCCCDCVGSFIGDLLYSGFICRNCRGQQSLPSKELWLLHVFACWNDRKRYLPLYLIYSQLGSFLLVFAQEWEMSYIYNRTQATVFRFKLVPSYHQG